MTGKRKATLINVIHLMLPAAYKTSVHGAVLMRVQSLTGHAVAQLVEIKSYLYKT